MTEAEDATLARLRRGIASMEPDLPGFGIAVLVFPLAAPEGNRVTFIGDASRPELLAALRELVGKWEHDAPPLAEPAP